MKIFASIVTADTVKDFYSITKVKLNYLISYAYLKGQANMLTNEYRSMIDSLYLDSGAYSAATGRANITVSEYQTYLKLYGSLFDQYFNLDDDFDNPSHNQWNQDFIAKGLPRGAKKPIPVVHDNDSPFAEFSLYVDLGYDYIAIGSTTKIPTPVFEKILKRYPKVKIHIFGRLDLDELKQYKPYSADAATWAHAAMNGNLLFWDAEDEKVERISVGGRDKSGGSPVHFKSYKKKKIVKEQLTTVFGFEYRDFLLKGGQEKMMLVNLFCFKQMEDFLNRK